MSPSTIPPEPELADRITSWLQTPAAYSPAPDRVERIETHISRVFLAGSLVYKLKKAVKFDFLDFSTLAAREYSCREEVRLNSRLAPDIYLGVVPITLEADQQLKIDGQGQVVEWLVKMRRLPTEKTLPQLHHRGELKPYHIDRLADLLVRFYAAQKPAAIAPATYRQDCLRHVRDNRRELLSVAHHLPRPVVMRSQGFQLQLLLLRPQLFDPRVAGGRIFDGHGDLRPEHICFTDPIAIFDCIEFSEELRRIDAADELAFLATECDFIGAPWVGPQLVRSYSRQSGDDVPPLLLNYYKAYRASVRAKVAALRADQLQGEKADDAVAEAKAHLALADSYATPYLRPLILVVGGLSGTGKSTLATALAEAFGAELLRSDVVRKELYPVAELAAPNQGVYQPELRQRVYEELSRRAVHLQRSGVSVVLDGTYASAASVRSTHAMMPSSAGQSLFIECRCSPGIARDRIATRLQTGADASDATLAVYEHQVTNWEPWPATVPQLQVDTEQPLADQMEAVLARLVYPT